MWYLELFLFPKKQTDARTWVADPVSAGESTLAGHPAPIIRSADEPMTTFYKVSSVHAVPIVAQRLSRN